MFLFPVQPGSTLFLCLCSAQCFSHIVSILFSFFLFSLFSSLFPTRYLKSSELNYSVGQLKTAQCFLSGTGCLQSNVTAIFYLERAALQEEKEAQYLLGNLHAQGYAQGFADGDADTNKMERGGKIATHWWLKSAINGFANAQYSIGEALLCGFGGLIRNEEESFVWFEKAASQDHADAQNELGTCFYQGRGIEQDFKKAASYYNLASMQGHKKAKKNLVLMREKGLDVPSHYPVALRNYTLVLRHP